MARVPPARAPPAHASAALAPPPAVRGWQDAFADLALVGAGALASGSERAGARDAAELAPPPEGYAIPWETRLVTTLPVSPVAAGWVVSLALAAGGAASFALSAEPMLVRDGTGSALSSELITAIVLSLLFGYTLAAGTYLNARISRDLVAAGRLRPEIFDPANGVWLHGLPASALRVGRIAGALGFGVGIAIVWGLGSPPASRTASGGWTIDPGQVWSGVLTPFLFVLLARAAAMTTVGSSSRQTGPLRIPAGEIDLLDMRPHLVEGRVGLRLALVWIVGVTLSSLLFYDPGFLLLMLPIVAAGLGVASLALLMPARRLHRRIREAKSRELTAVRQRLAAARDAVMAGETGAEGHLADLLAYADHLSDVREWPFDNHTLSRFVLYLLIPLGSWLGGALVERMVSSVLD